MPVDLQPDMMLAVMPIPSVDGIQISPPIVYQTLASDWNAESGTGIDGRYNQATGEAEGKAAPKLQDTYKTGTGSRTGLAFTQVTGTWRDDWVSPSTGKYGLLFSDAAADSHFEIEETTVGTLLEHRQVVINRGMSATAATKTAVATNAYLELCQPGLNGNYRIALEWCAPIRLEYQEPGYSTWNAVAIARNLGDLEGYLEANNRQVRIRIKPDHVRQMLVVEVGDNGVLRHTPKRNKRGVTLLPDYQRYDLYGENGVATLEVYPLRYQPLVVTKSARDIGAPIPNLGSAQVLPNSSTDTDITQSHVATLSQDVDNGLAWEATAELADAGDGLGSAAPAKLSDITVWIPGQWVRGWYLGSPSFPPVLHVHETQVWDDISRMMTSSATITMNNRSAEMTGIFGNYWGRLTATNGQLWADRMQGVIAGSPGMRVIRHDPVRIAQATLHDPSYKLTVPLGQEIILDGWCLYSAVRMLLEIGQIHPMYAALIPYYPFGPAGYDCPWPTLGRGTGLSPKYRYTPEHTALGVLAELVQDAGVPDPLTGANVPFFMGFDRAGQFHFEPFDPRALPIVAGYSDWDTGYGQIQDMQVENSIQDLRTELTFQGHDAYTNELMNLYVPMPWNLDAVGYRYPWVERNSRWASEEYLFRLAQSAQVAASMPSQVIRMRVPFNPLVFAGQLIYVSEGNALGRAGMFVITQMDSSYGMSDQTGRSGQQECYSIITARAAEQYIPA